MSQEYWNSKDKHLNPQINWEIIQRAEAYKLGNRRGICSLCTTEAWKILMEKKEKGEDCINFRQELTVTCRHTSRYRLTNAKNITY